MAAGLQYLDFPRHASQHRDLISVSQELQKKPKSTCDIHVNSAELRESNNTVKRQLLYSENKNTRCDNLIPGMPTA